MKNMINVGVLIAVLFLISILSGCQQNSDDNLQEITLMYNEGYNFQEQEKYSGEFVDVFMKVDLLYGDNGGGDKNMLESRSVIYDNGAVDLKDATPVPKEDYYATFFNPKLNHVYSFRLWSINEDFENMPDFAIKVIKITENESITFIYDKAKFTALDVN